MAVRSALKCCVRWWLVSYACDSAGTSLACARTHCRYDIASTAHTQLVLLTKCVLTAAVIHVLTAAATGKARQLGGHLHPAHASLNAHTQRLCARDGAQGMGTCIAQVPYQDVVDFCQSLRHQVNIAAPPASIMH